MSKYVYEVMHDGVISVLPTDSLKQAAELMASHNIGFLPVINDGAVIGVLTDRDIVVHAVAEGLDFHTKVEKIMTHEVVSCTKDDEINKVAKTMGEYQVRRIPVVQDNQLVGVLTMGDLESNFTTSDLAKDAMSDVTKDIRPRGKNEFDYVEVDNFRL